MTCETLQGYVVMSDGSEVSYDALPNSMFRVIFPQVPWLIMFLQGFSMPGVDVKEVPTATPYVDMNEIGEKLIYTPFTVTFLIDKNLKNYREVHDWMKRMTVAGTKVGETADPVLVIGGKEMIRFCGAWPTFLGGMEFRTDVQDVQYMTATAQFNYDYFEFM